MTADTAPDGQRLAGLSAALGLPISAPQRAGLGAYVDLLARWNATYNLTAVREREAVWAQHIADCLAVLPALDRHLATGDARRVLDVGSGGGLPGVVLALMRPALDVTCIDAVGKKAAFVRQVAGALTLPNLHAVHGRIEALRASPFDLVTSRAFASLADFVRLTRPLLAPGGSWLAMKGKLPADELAALPADVTVFHVEPIGVPGLDAERCLVWIKPKTP
ncbi:MAG: 16S rRNA (guanine(527)-N(7))-methyltransferase RsmG [Burkholderiaceae bacterium]|nr:16S rRNA (guanine(527)-N(7))-methyltransferase RsmG [Burkholderiaceae bacterium]MCZ8176328.1 16S rRNA (guanine(527)-N(7))-methyltransferase RsmG [Burkholderiaceae bacterium]